MTRRAAVLINLASGRGNGKGAKLKALLEAAPNVHVETLHRFDDLDPAMQAFAKARITDLFISSGDGTVQAVLSHIAESGQWHAPPSLCVLPHGTTNLSAGDLGFAEKNIRSQAKFVASLPPAETLTRHTMRVTNPRGQHARHGFTLGAGAAATATRHAQLSYNDKGVKGSFASFATMASGLAKAAFTRAAPHDSSRLDRPCPISVESGGRKLLQGDHLMFIATTLEHLFFRTKPFWGERHGPIRATSIPYPVPNVLRWAWPVMYGGEKRKVPPGAVSFSGHSFAITCAEPFVMDGEFFEGPVDGPLRVEAGPAFRFITRPRHP
ncbi:MAG: acylglycerol kinase family protein [Alphaproteobacteria bacterium]|nr:acylglycerol kinase family protein [Alphaproteobacteria bacterium]